MEEIRLNLNHKLKKFSNTSNSNRFKYKLFISLLIRCVKRKPFESLNKLY